MGLPSNLPGFTAKLDKNQVNSNEDATVEIHYDPAAQAILPAPMTLAVDVQPFSQDFPIEVAFKPSN